MELIEKQKYEKLVRKLLKTNGFLTYNKEYDDVYQEAWLGLCKAVDNHKNKNKYEVDNWRYYQQYIDGYIKNYKKDLQEIKIYKNKEGGKYSFSTISLQTEVYSEDEHPIYLEDIIPDKNSEIKLPLDLSETIEDKNVITICELIMEGYTQQEVAGILKISQTKVCLALKSLKNNKELYEQLKDRLSD